MSRVRAPGDALEVLVLAETLGSVLFFAFFPIDEVLKIRYYYNNIREILAQINDKENREAFVYAVNMIKIPVKYLVQNRLVVKIKLGSEDPAKTGEYVGLMYVLSAVLGFNLLLEPDFEKEIFELDAGFKGHVSVYKVLVWVLELYSNDKLKIVIDDIL